LVPYEESIRVPLVVRGPGFPEGRTVPAPAINADYAPTILAAAGVQPGLTEDGLPLQGLVADPNRLRDFPIESYEAKRDAVPFHGVRTPRYVYVAYDDGERELYDLAADPYELQNVHGDPRYAAAEAWLAARAEVMYGCSGDVCRAWTGEAPGPAR
jgi:arylsulfatase A-like enzyme